MKSFNWPQASISENRVFLVQALWYEDHLEISEVDFRYYSSGDTEFTKLKNRIQTEFFEVAGPEGDIVDEWGFTLRVLNLLPEELDNRQNFTLSYHNEVPDFIPIMFQRIEEFLERFWDREWVVSFWTLGDTFEWKIRKFGLGPLAQSP